MYSRSEASFLQRQNSVRLFGPIKGPTCGMEEDHMRKVFIEEYVKHREMENAEAQNLLYCIAKA